MGEAGSWDEARSAAKRELETSGHAQRQPVFLVCGQTGAGKTTTINYLFGQQVGAVGQFTRGTTKDEPYVWEAGGEHVHVIDLPGFGDTDENDRTYREMYRKHVPRADGFVVVATPPRPGSGATQKTVRTLLEFGAQPSQIVFGYNRLSMLNTEDGEGEPVRVVGLHGPQTQAEKDEIEKGRRQFFEDVCAMGGRHKQAYRFHLEQFIPYDAKSGWNVFKILWELVNSLPHSLIVETDALIETSMADFATVVGRRIRDRREALERREQEVRFRMNQALLDQLEVQEERIRQGLDKCHAALAQIRKERADFAAERAARTVASSPAPRASGSSGSKKKTPSAKPKPADSAADPVPPPSSASGDGTAKRLEEARRVVEAGRAELADITLQKSALTGEATAARQVVAQTEQVRKGLWGRVGSFLKKVTVEVIGAAVVELTRRLFTGGF
ncbi:GTPase [Streptomyces sp. R08]|uniref:GTPase n=1 Tax=Streptomyces sp. R08 TaxID=3238624 RepID=A0AB39MP07_9ACTN